MSEKYSKETHFDIAPQAYSYTWDESQLPTKSEELYKGVLEADAQRNGLEDDTSKGLIAGKISHIVSRYVLGRDVKRAESAAKKDYQENKALYQDEALHDAAREGVAINLPEPETRIKSPTEARRVFDASGAQESIEELPKLRERYDAQRKKVVELREKTEKDPGYKGQLRITEMLTDTLRNRIVQQRSSAEQRMNWTIKDRAIAKEARSRKRAEKKREDAEKISA